MYNIRDTINNRWEQNREYTAATIYDTQDKEGIVGKKSLPLIKFPATEAVGDTWSRDNPSIPVSDIPSTP